MRHALLILSILTLPAAAVAQGKLEQVREAVDSSRSSDDKSKSDADSFADSSRPCDPQPTVSGESSESPDPWFSGGVSGGFTKYPYATTGTTYLWLDRPSGDWLSARAGLEYGNDFDGLGRVGLRLFLDTETRFGLKSDWDYYTERLDCGCRDDLWIGDVTGTYRVAQAEGLHVYVGFGARFLMDRGRDWAGVNFLAGFDGFPGKPVHLFGSAEGGTLGHAGLWRLRGGAGYMWGRAELFAGYDWLRIGQAELHGPFAGVRVWY
jgi:hypothetical protein